MVNSARPRPGAHRFFGKTPRAAGLEFLHLALAVVAPPVGVFLRCGLDGRFWLNLLLTTLGYIPGVVHAICVMGEGDASAPSEGYATDVERQQGK